MDQKSVIGSEGEMYVLGCRLHLLFDSKCSPGHGFHSTRTHFMLKIPSKKKKCACLQSAVTFWRVIHSESSDMH